MIHNCDFSDSNLINNQGEMIDYLISCENQKIQKIELEKTNSIRKISIIDNSNVTIACSRFNRTSEKIILDIYDEPSITFQYYCHFEQIRIQGSPKLHLFKKSLFSVNKLYLYNKTYRFPFDFKVAFYDKENTNHKNTQEINEKTIECENNIFQISLKNNYLRTKCGNSYDFILPYSKIPKYSFKINNSKTYLVNQCTSDQFFTQKVNLTLSSLNFQGNSKVTFKNIPQIKAVSQYTDQNEHGTWLQIGSGCFWKEYEYDSEYEEMVGRGWRKVCKNDQSYLYCCESSTKKRKVIFISKSATLAIIIVILATIVTIFISTLLIAYFRDKKMDFSSNEDM